MEKDVDKLITGWFERARDKQLTHEECSTRLNRWHYRFGIPIIILTTGAAAATFYWLDLNDPVKMGIGIASGLAALLACMQTFLGLAHRADQHRIACARYGALRRSLEILKTFSPSDPIDLHRSITDIQRQMDRLAETSPAVPIRVKKKVYKELESQSRVISLLNDATSQRLNASHDRQPKPVANGNEEHAATEAA
jgi:hypothetical protein